MDAALKETLLSLPLAPLHDLLRSGACTFCALRFLNVRDRVYTPSASSTSDILNELQTTFASLQTVHAHEEPNQSFHTCTICLGILQGAQNADFENVTKKKHFAESAIMQEIELQGYQFDSFSLEITVPGAALVREHALWCYLRQRHETFSTNDNIVSLKEAVKWLLIPQLEELLGRKFDTSSGFRIAVIFRHPASNSELQFLSTCSGGDPKRRRGKSGSYDGVASVSAQTGESVAAIQRSLASMSTETFARHFPCPPPKVDTPCEVIAACYREAVYVGGRYLKYSRNISQSRWMVDDERMGEGSVQEVVGDVAFPQFKADSYKFHAAGREDIDVRMLGTGRPFILEILNARIIPTPVELTKLENIINSSKTRWVKVNGLRQIGNDAWTLMREGEAEKQKEYTAVVWLSRPFTEADFKAISALKELEIQQKTPVRVLHRRSPLIRSRTIHWMSCEALHDSKHYFLLHLCTQAGTYIKEFVHGDLGRTYPNVGSILNCEAAILCLDVTNVKMDFL